MIRFSRLPQKLEQISPNMAPTVLLQILPALLHRQATLVLLLPRDHCPVAAISFTTVYNYHLHRFVLMSWAEGGERPLIMLNGSFFFSPGEDYRINGDCQLPAITIKNTFSGNNVMLDNKRKTSQEFVQIFQMRRRTAVKYTLS